MFKKYLHKKYLIPAAIVVIIIILIGIFTGRGGAATFQSATATIGNVVQTVSVTGTVSPIGKADLAFEKSGVISRIYVSVGQSVKAGDPIASLDSSTDEANLESAQATLADMTSNGATLSTASKSLANAEKDAVNASHDGFAKAQSSLINFTDSFFNNPQTPNPTINIRTNTPDTANSINAERLQISDLLSKWSAELGTSTPDVASGLITDSHSYLAAIKQFMSDLSNIVSALSPANSGLSQTQITADVATMNSGLSTLNGAVDSVTAAQSELSLAGNSTDSVAAQQARVDGAQASLDQDTIVSPIDGVVTKADPNVGEFIAAGNSGFAVQSNGAFKIEAYVPEADIAKIAVGNLSSTTLDAYGSDVDFPAKVISIDPAETVLEGVPTYKVTLEFVQNDPRVLSGMTANLIILTHEASNVLEIPYRAIIDDNGTKSVRVVNADGKTYATVPVTVGLKGSDGTIEIVSGLSAGQNVVTYVK